ncbi:hypothetical protein G6F42_014717 [Rhizopus arrhizus]|nr:hypothetical protein G6F42_014717 [Rhizopus arrhizus]
MQIKFLSLATLALLFTAASAATRHQASGKEATFAEQSNVPGSGNEATFNDRVAEIQNDPEIKYTLEFLIQQIAAKLNEGSSSSAQTQPGSPDNFVGAA